MKSTRRNIPLSSCQSIVNVRVDSNGSRQETFVKIVCLSIVLLFSSAVARLLSNGMVFDLQPLGHEFECR